MNARDVAEAITSHQELPEVTSHLRPALVDYRASVIQQAITAETKMLEAEIARMKPIAERTGCLLADYEAMKQENTEARKLLESVLNSCVHPDIAVRAVFVDVAPTRKFLKNRT